MALLSRTVMVISQRASRAPTIETQKFCHRKTRSTSGFPSARNHRVRLLNPYRLDTPVPSPSLTMKILPLLLLLGSRVSVLSQSAYTHLASSASTLRSCRQSWSGSGKPSLGKRGSLIRCQIRIQRSTP